MSRFKQVFVYAAESDSVLSLCYCGSWNISEGWYWQPDVSVCASSFTKSFLGSCRAGCLWKNNSVYHFLFPLSKLSPGNLFCCFPFIPLHFLRICCLCWGDFEVQAGCAGVAVMWAAVRALLSFRISHTGCMKSFAYQRRWAFSSGCCKAQNIASKVRNSVMVFVRTSLWWKWISFHASCSHRDRSIALSIYHSSSKQDKGRRNCLCSLIRTDRSGQTTCLPVLPLFTACWGCPGGPFSSQQMLYCICTLLCWNLFLLGAWRFGHPMRQLAHSCF